MTTMPKNADLEDILNDPRYRELSRKRRNELGFYPHRAVWNPHPDDRRLVLLLVKSGQGPDYALGINPLKAAWQKQRSGKVRSAYIGQIDPDRDRKLLAWDTAGNILHKINGYTPREGEHGPYLYMEPETFEVTGAGDPNAQRYNSKYGYWEDDDLD